MLILDKNEEPLVIFDEYDTVYFDQSKKDFRLPTEAEWEYMARKQSDGTLCPLSYASGAAKDWCDAAETGKVAWFDNNTHEVGALAANALGLHDISCNVCEWCYDWLGGITAEGKNV